MLLRAPAIDGLAEAGVPTPTSYRSRRFGPVTIGDMGVRRDWTLDCEDVGSHFYLQLPLAGRYRSRHGGVDGWFDRRVASVCQPGSGPLLARWTAGYRSLCVTLDGRAVRTALAGLLGAHARVSFRPSVDIASGEGRAWAELVLSVRRYAAAPASLLQQPMVAGPLAEGIVNGFLLAAPHSHAAALRDPVPHARPAAVRAAVDLMEGRPEAPLTVSELAAHCGVSVRALQSAFRRHLGMPPLAYLREVRLRRAHEELRAADPASASVAAIANRWGFAHLGRFAAAHEAKYGQTPLKTLRG